MRNGQISKRKLTPKQLAEILEVTENTLLRWRNQKRGPPYYREVNQIFYYRDELEAWRQAGKWS